MYGGSVRSTGDRLGRQEKAKQGNLWDGIRSQMTEVYFVYVGGYRVVKSTMNRITVTMGGIRGLCSGEAAVSQGFGKRGYFDIPKVCYHRCKTTPTTTIEGLHKVKTAFCQGRF